MGDQFARSGIQHSSPSLLPFSIITAAYQAASKLDATIETVLREDPSLFEYIVVDGGSDDSSIEVLKKYRDRIRWISEPDSGVYDAMNKGIAISAGRYLYFLGAGDVLYPGVLSRIAAELPDHDRAVVYGNFSVPNDDTKYYGHVGKYWLCLVYDICHQSAFYGREVFEMLGKYDLRYPVRSDYLTNIRAFCDERIEKKYVDLTVACYERGGMSELLIDNAFVEDFPAIIRENLKIPWAAGPIFDFALRLRFNASFRAFGRRVFQAFRTVLRRKG
jgi:glycosyltransferase involved in cell wall biosynthesis